MRQNHVPFNPQMAEQLRPIAAQNVIALRQLRSKAVREKQFKYANQINRQATKWSEITVAGPK